MQLADVLTYSCAACAVVGAILGSLPLLGIAISLGAAGAAIHIAATKPPTQKDQRMPR